MSPVHRCRWPDEDPQYVRYHDEEWGVPIHDDKDLYAKLVLDGFQAGLSWITILRKREAFLEAFDQLDPCIVRTYDENDIQRLLADRSIVRSRAKIEAAISNAGIWMTIMEDGPGAFSDLLWSFTGHETLVNTYERETDIPTRTEQSEDMSKSLRRLGWKFAGPTICYAFMQAVGMVNDHVTSCFRHPELSCRDPQGEAPE